MAIKQCYLHDIQILPGLVNDFVHGKLLLFCHFLKRLLTKRIIIIIINN